MKTRMQPIGNAWQKLPRIVRDLSAELGKQIELEMHGAETELDRQVLELVKDPLTHLVRNCADHGIESAAERRAAGKPQKGTIRLSACHQGGHIIIEIARRRPRPRRGAHPRQGHRARICQRGRDCDEIRGGNLQSDLHARLLHRRARDQHFRPRRRHGRGARQHGADRRHGRSEVRSRRRDHLYDQDSAHAGDRFRAHRRGGRRTLRHPAAFRARTRARRLQRRTPHRTDQGHAGAAAAQQVVAAHQPQGNPAPRRKRRRQRLRRRHAGRQPGLRHRRRRRIPHRRDRDQADVVETAAHRGVFRHDDPRRRHGDHDHRPERNRAGARPRHAGGAGRQFQGSRTTRMPATRT